MNTAIGKLRVKIGNLEIECEGSESFIQSQIPATLSLIAEINFKNDVANDSTSEKGSQNGKPLAMTVSSVAARIGGKTGPDLARCAAVYLTLVKQQDVFTRIDLLNAMKSATGYYNENHSKNLSGIISSLEKDRELRGVSEGKYSLDATVRSKLERDLA